MALGRSSFTKWISSMGIVRKDVFLLLNWPAYIIMDRPKMLCGADVSRRRMPPPELLNCCFHADKNDRFYHKSQAKFGSTNTIKSQAKFRSTHTIKSQANFSSTHTQSTT